MPRDHGLTQSTVVMTAEDTSVVMAAATLPAVQVTQQRTWGVGWGGQGLCLGADFLQTL